MNSLAFILDMDGVIIDSNPLHAKVWQEYLRQYELPVDTIGEFMHGKRNDEIVRHVFGNHLDDQEIAAHGAAKEAIYRQRMAPLIGQHLTPGLLDFLNRHRERRMGVASNAEPANVDFVLDGAALRPYFRAVVNGHQVTRAKPDPEIYLLTTHLLGVEPRHTIVFEDSAAGIQAARAAGTLVVAVRSSDAQLPPADFAVRDFRDPALEDWIRCRDG